MSERVYVETGEDFRGVLRWWVYARFEGVPSRSVKVDFPFPQWRLRRAKRAVARDAKRVQRRLKGRS